MNERTDTKRKQGRERQAYAKPELERVDLALAETLSSGCKQAGPCEDPFTGISEPGS